MCGATSRTACTAAPRAGVPHRPRSPPARVTTLGRGEDNDVVLSDTSVSRRHARIVRTAEGFRIEDLDSFNGTAVGGVDLHGGAAGLADGTELSVGDVRLVFEQPRDTRIGSRTM